MDFVVGHCDVTGRKPIDAVFEKLHKEWGSIDFVVHAIAFSDKSELDGRYVDTTLDNFTKTMAISCYSFTAVTQRAEKIDADSGSLLTLTYYGAEKWMPHYNVMGVAKAALETSVKIIWRCVKKRSSSAGTCASPWNYYGTSGAYGGFLHLKQDDTTRRCAKARSLMKSAIPRKPYFLSNRRGVLASSSRRYGLPPSA